MLTCQQYALVMLWRINRENYNRHMVALLQRKRSYYLRKLKIIQRRRLARKKRQFWFTPGKTDQWWQNMISRETPEEQWVKKFRMTRKDFFGLVGQLQPYISPDELSTNYRLMSTEKGLQLLFIT